MGFSDGFSQCTKARLDGRKMLEDTADQGTSATSGNKGKLSDSMNRYGSLPADTRSTTSYSGSHSGYFRSGQMGLDSSTLKHQLNNGTRTYSSTSKYVNELKCKDK
jgi:hypothetical protein